MPARYIKQLILLLLPLFISSCLKDELKDCGEPGLELTYAYLLHEDSYDKFPEEVDHLHIFVYDGTGSLYMEKNIARASLIYGNTVSLDIEPGKYTIVTWGNIDTNNFVYDGMTTLSGHKAGLVCFGGDGCITTTQPGTMFHGLADVEVKTRNTTTFTVEMMNNASFVNLRIELDPELVGAEIETVIYGSNTLYTYDNLIHTKSPEVTYIAGRDREGYYLRDKLQVYRLFMDDEDIRIRVTDITSGTVFIDEPLVPSLLKGVVSNHQLYLDRKENHYLETYLNKDGTAALSSVKSWDEEEDETTLS